MCTLKAGHFVLHAAVQLCATTLMPRQPGLLGLLCLLFGPCVMLRYDETKQRLSGCRAGSGGDADGYPLYAEHDAEITFDCHFTRKDVENVNVARTHMNRIVRRVFALGQLHLHADVHYERKALIDAVLKLMREPRKMLYDYAGWRKMKRKQAEREAIGGHYPWQNTVTRKPYQHDAAAVCENYLYQVIDLSCFGDDDVQKAQKSTAVEQARSKLNGDNTAWQNNVPDSWYKEDDDGLGAWGQTRNELIEKFAYEKSKPMILR